MSRPEMTHARDMTFHIARREFGFNIPVTDLDFLEFDNFEPVLLWEAKSIKSHWRDGKRTAGMKAQWNLAKRANVPYVVVEHNEDWSEVTVCKVGNWERMQPIILSEQAMTLKQFVSWLYEVRDRDIERELGNILLEQKWTDIIPDKLEPVTFRKKT